MELFTLFAKLGMDTQEYEQGIKKAKEQAQETAKVVDQSTESMSESFRSVGESVKTALKSATDYKHDVMTLAQTYKQVGMSMSEAMKKAYAEIDKSAYDMTKKTTETVKQGGEEIADKAKQTGEKIKESVQGVGNNTETVTGKIKNIWERMFSSIESNGKSKLESLSAWTLAKANMIADGIKNVFNKIAEIGKSAITAAADISAEKAQFSATFEGIEAAANGVFSGIEKDTGILETRLQQVGTKAFSQFKGAGLGAVESLSMMDKYTRLAADAAAYYDISLEDADVRLRSFLRGNTEAGDAIGLFTSESQRNSKAVELYGTKWTNLTEAQKQNLMLNVAQEIYDQSGATGQAAREMDGWVNVTGNLQRVWKDVLGVIGTPIYDSLTPVVQKLTDFLSDETIQLRLGMLSASLGKVAGYVFDGVIDFFDKILAWSNGDAELDPTVQAITGIAGALATIGGMVFDGVINVLKWLFNGLDEKAAESTTEFLKFIKDFFENPAFQTAASVIGGIALAWLLLHAPLVLVGAAVGVIATHWKEIKEWAGNALEAVKTFFGTTLPDTITSVVSGIADWFEKIKSRADEALTNVKNFFETKIVDNVKEFVSGVADKFNDIKTWATNAKDNVKTFFSTNITDNVTSFVSSVADKFGDIKTWATDAKENVLTFFETQIVDNVKEFVSGVADKFSDIKAWASDAKTNLDNFINTHIPEGFLSTVESALETVAGLVDGIKSAWDSFVYSLNTTNVQKGTQSIQEGWESGGVAGAASAAWDSAWYNPSNWGKKNDNSTSPGKATGLDYVPYDNFNANLHAGEAVLNRADATAYREGRTSTGIDYAMLGQVVGAAVCEALNGVGVNMDGQRVGKITAPVVSREIAREAHARRYVTV